MDKLSEWSHDDDNPEEMFADSLVEVEEKRKFLCIQMEYCKNLTLSSALKAGLLRENETKKRILTQLAYILTYIHEQKLVHKAIKASNIFVDKALNLKLGDFGEPTHTHLQRFFEKSNENGEKLCEIHEKFTEKVEFFGVFAKVIAFLDGFVHVREDCLRRVV